MSKESILKTLDSQMSWSSAFEIRNCEPLLPMLLVYVGIDWTQKEEIRVFAFSLEPEIGATGRHSVVCQRVLRRSGRYIGFWWKKIDQSPPLSWCSNLPRVT